MFNSILGEPTFTQGLKVRKNILRKFCILFPTEPCFYQAGSNNRISRENNL